MARYVLIESRDPFETNDVQFCRDLASRLAGQGDEVTLFLVQNGVLPARVGFKANGLSALAAAGIKVLADTFSLSERGIPAGALASGVEPAPLDIVIDAMSAGSKVIWH
jgi:hypothetical protein